MTRIMPSKPSKVKVLPCKECGIKVPVGDDAVAVTCVDCTQKSLTRYNAMSKEAPKDAGQEGTIQDDDRRDSVPEGRDKVQRIKRPRKQTVKGPKKVTRRSPARPNRKALKSSRK